MQRDMLALLLLLLPLLHIMCRQVAIDAVDIDVATAWHPDVDDSLTAAAADVDARLDVLHQHLGVSGGLDPSRQLGYYIRILKAVRSGDLGKVMLDDAG